VKQIVPVGNGWAERLVELRWSQLGWTQGAEGTIIRILRQFGNRRSGLEVIDPGLRINKIEWLHQITLGKQTAAQASNVRNLQRESIRQLTPDGKIKGISMGRLDGLVDSPGD